MLPAAAAPQIESVEALERALLGTGAPSEPGQNVDRLRNALATDAAVLERCATLLRAAHITGAALQCLDQAVWVRPRPAKPLDIPLPLTAAAPVLVAARETSRPTQRLMAIRLLVPYCHDPGVFDFLIQRLMDAKAPLDDRLTALQVLPRPVWYVRRTDRSDVRDHIERLKTLATSDAPLPLRECAASTLRVVGGPPAARNPVTEDDGRWMLDVISDADRDPRMRVAMIGALPSWWRPPEPAFAEEVRARLSGIVKLETIPLEVRLGACEYFAQNNYRDVVQDLGGPRALRRALLAQGADMTCWICRRRYAAHAPGCNRCAWAKSSPDRRVPK